MSKLFYLIQEKIVKEILNKCTPNLNLKKIFDIVILIMLEKAVCFGAFLPFYFKIWYFYYFKDFTFGIFLEIIFL